MFNKILIPIDFSQDIDKLCKILSKIDTEKIILLNIIDKLELSLYNEIFSAMASAPPDTGVSNEKDLENTHIYKKNSEKLDTYKLNLLKRGYEVETYIKYGIPYKKITEFAKNQNIDLIIIPAIGKRLSLLKEVMLMGGTVTRVLRQSDIPVLIIR